MNYGPGPTSTKKLTTLDAGYHERTLQRLMILPPFLRRKGEPMNPTQVANLISPNRSWAPFRDHKSEEYKEAKRQRERTKVFVADRELPVVVSVRGQDGILARHPSMDVFEAEHDFGTYPVTTTADLDGETVVVVTAKPWAKKMVVSGIHDDAKDHPAPAKPRVQRDFSQPDAAGKPVSATSSLGTILRLMLAGDRTVEEIVVESGVEGGVVSAEDKVLHRIRFVLFRHHGVGHTITDGKVSAVLPSGFDGKTIFKAGS